MPHKKQNVPGFMKEIERTSKERKGEPARKAARTKGSGYQMHAWMRPKTKEQKAQELTRKMKKGYRKGYRVGKRPAARKSSGR